MPRFVGCIMKRVNTALRTKVVIHVFVSPMIHTQMLFPRYFNVRRQYMVFRHQRIFTCANCTIALQCLSNKLAFKRNLTTLQWQLPWYFILSLKSFINSGITLQIVNVQSMYQLHNIKMWQIFRLRKSSHFIYPQVTLARWCKNDWEVSLATEINADRTYGRIGLMIAPIGYLLLLILPIYLEVIDLHYDLTDGGNWRRLPRAGHTVFTLFIDKINIKTCLLVALDIVVASNLILLFDKRFDLLCVLRIVSGFGGGLLAAIGTLCVNQTSQPNRWFGFYAAVAILIQTVCFIVVPLVFEWFSINGIFLVLALISCLPLMAWRQLPNSFSRTFELNNDKKSHLLPSRLTSSWACSVYFYSISDSAVFGPI